MSRINDALKRAQAAQQQPSPHSSDTSQLPATAPEQSATRGIGLAVPFVFALIALLGLFFLWQIHQKRAAQNQAPAETQSTAMAISMPEKASQPAAPVETVTVSTPKPNLTHPSNEKPIAQSSVPGTPVLQPAASPTRPAAPGPPPLKLQAVLFSGQNSSAMINGQTVMAGDSVGEYRVSAIYQRSVTLTSAKCTNILTLNQ